MTLWNYTSIIENENFKDIQGEYLVHILFQLHRPLFYLKPLLC